MIKRIALYALLGISLLGMATASVDVLCLVLWYFDGDAEALADHGQLPLHHPDAPESHVNGTDHGDLSSVLLLSAIVDDALRTEISVEVPPLVERGPYLQRVLKLSDPLILPLDKPPQPLS